MFENIRIVLIDPQHPGNIGAVARAMKTMALTNLYLLRPREFPSYEAERRAMGSVDILENAVVVQELDEAIGDCTLVVGSSARSRTHPRPMLLPRECGAKLVEESRSGASVALLFGTERTGLSNPELERCNFHVRIPTSAEFKSLNLGAAAQLLCYEIFMASLTDRPIPEDSGRYPSARELEHFFEYAEEALKQRGFIREDNRYATIAKIRRIFGRARPESGELKILHSLLRLIWQEPRKD